MANGACQITITANIGGGYSFQWSDISTQGAVTFAADNSGGFKLTADQGVYAFAFVATNFQFSAAAMTWKDPSINRNLTWASKDNQTFVMTNINFVTIQQAVSFTINPDRTTTVDVEIPAGSLTPIDPTVLNNPFPGGSGMVLPDQGADVRDMVMAG